MEEKPEFSPKDQQFLDVLKITKNPRTASQLIYGTGNLFRALQHKKKVVREIVNILNRAGLKQKYLAEKLKTIIDTEEDNEVILRALDMCFKLHGSYAPQEVEVEADFDIWRHLSIDEIKREIIETLTDGETDQSQ